MTASVAFIGLGVMGYPMAGHLANGGYTVTVYNRTTEKAKRWAEQYSGRWAATPAEAAQNADIVFACVGNDDDLRAVTLGEHGAFATMKPGSIFVDHTTTSATVAKELAAVAAKINVAFLDAPVSGGQAGAENGALTVMLGGEQAAYEAIGPALNCFAKMHRLLGPVGAGQTAKMVNQICIAGVVQGLAEALHFATHNGLDANAVVDVISKGAAQSWQMENRAHTMVEGQFDFGFAVDWMRKDLGIVLDQAKASGCHLPLTALVDQFYSQVQSMGGGRWDTSSLIALLNRQN
ncbi:NAD(P)-dependent oxidoreductase [Aestuariibacter halophilus]|uniref:NAD(P)-dependent oxidoreductase n=1 Tax=Fluctibacter halophilus TaxID=226011 RepID=A0ABS8G3V9_9ALTE|nr:NAD(P)-dependent oxidoreductase [Aestuariibacter halophilus]MCC2615282.1 NAD(P)-dependent oxidoreductase [Aestuariibacter halophilus]